MARMRFSHLFILALLFAAAVTVRAEDDDDDGNAKAAEATDAPAAEPEVAIEGIDPAVFKELEDKAEKHAFQAEVTRLMDIIINSLYSNREVFLRELISNASDALDKIRFKSLTDKAQLGEGELANLDIRIDYNKKAHTLSIIDKGVGMTKEELVKHLGTVASSGTTQFVKAVAAGGDSMSLIGQFGVGFYSVYLVADKVSVVTKHNDDKQYIWTSKADGAFTIIEDPRGNTMGRGTAVTLHLKEDAVEFLDQSTLERIVGKYSEFINFPIYLHKSETRSKEVPIDTPEPEITPTPIPPGVGKDFDPDNLNELERKVYDAEQDRVAPEDEPVPEDVKTEEDEDIDIKDEDEAEEDKKPKTKTIQEEVWEWKQLNENKAIWTRKPDDVTQEEYDNFYKAITKDEQGTAAHMHFSAEGEIVFKAILFVPKTAPYDLYDKYYGKSTGLKLYVRRVMIADEFDEFMPRYLNFIKGVVDSDDLPLNVSRETLSKNRVLKVMGKKLVRKALEMLKQISDESDEAAEELKKLKEEGEGKKDEADEDKKDDAEEDKEKEEDEKKKKEEELEKKASKYTDFFKNFGKSIKLGVIEDSANRSKLTKLLRFITSKSDEKFVSLQSYVDRMKEDQKYIYYITGENLESVKASPFLEQLEEKGLEVVYMVDPLDEYLMSNVQDFEGKKFMSVTKEGLKLDESDAAKNREKKLKEKYAKLTDWLKEVYGEKVEKVVVSNRIAESPCVLVTSQYGWSANMERIMKAQTFADADRNKYMLSKKTLEINPRHPLIVKLKERSESNPDDQQLRDYANLMYDAALLNSGFAMDSPKDFASRMHRVLSGGLDIAADAKLVPEEELVGADDEADSATDSAPAEDKEDLDAADADKDEL